ncbi:MAG TPA: Uma2 family endonuclease [Thermomicrobiales bacterium]|nr:Uma2 family endonuclease [Thermomicrobiales bacterium]
MATTAARTMSVEEFLQLPDDGCQYELVQGELIEMPGSGFEHSAINAFLILELGIYNRQHRLGVITSSDGAYVLNRETRTVLVPDVAFTRADRLPPPGERAGVLELVPDLVVEVASPNDSANMISEKVREYLDAGVQLVWVVFPKRRMLQVFTPDQNSRLMYEDDIVDGGDVLPGFELRVGAIFE